MTVRKNVAWSCVLASQPVLANNSLLAILERAMKRERAAREQAESLLESKSRELYFSNEALQDKHRLVKRQKAEIEKAHEALQEAQAQLVQSEKLASVGQLAAGVAHEINNPISFITSNLGTLKSYVEVMAQLTAGYRSYLKCAKQGSVQPDILEKMHQLEEEEDIEFVLEDIEGLLTDSIEGSKRIKDIVQGLMSFSRVDDERVSDEDIHEGINSTLKVVANEIKYNCEVIKNFGVLPLVSCNLAQVNQVFMNLIVNAAQAMESQGTITITTKIDGANAVLEFRDNASGIPANKIGSIFDPFFTTKPIGSGTGLGLSISYGIIQRHGGTIEVDSEVGVGTTFSVRLPLNGEDVSPA
jgi:signal transduction histidine kinase